MTELVKHDIVGRLIKRIGHSRLSDPKFVFDGIGPVQFRSHYVLLNNGVVIDLFTAELSLSSVDKMVHDGETNGISVDPLLGRTITAV